jgi:phosphatidylserine/phosphatidylglycerophosphate/cardiolipin synthase-like enzyme
MTQTYHPGSVPIDLRKRSATATAQWLLERAEDSNSPIYHANQLEVLICGEEGFARILQDIRQARHSVEIICWGFDPAMELERKGNTWPRGPTWGDLLREVAAGKYNNGSPVNVRVLCWNEGMISTMAKNTPGYGTLNADQVRRLRHHERLSGKPHEAGLTPQERRRHFNAMWFFDATHGTSAHLSFKVRPGDADKVRQSLAEERSARLAMAEHQSLVQASTAHQKTILIDYDHAEGEHAVGYVMGLNGVTDYWDTRKHLFHDPRRGQSWEGGGDEFPGLKPLQDYACRICGEALISVSKNFVDAWNRVATADQKIQRAHDLRSPPAGLKVRAGKAAHRAQIVRTQAEEGDKTIQRLYRQATSFASNYIYIENQYFQYTEWARYLKQLRRDFIAAWKVAGHPCTTSRANPSLPLTTSQKSLAFFVSTISAYRFPKRQLHDMSQTGASPKACCARFPFLHANCAPQACFLHPLPVSGTDELIRPIRWPRSSTNGTARPMSKKGSPSPIRVIAGWTSLRKKLNGNGWIKPTNPCLQDAKPSRSAISVRKNQWQKEADRRGPHLAPKKNAG